MLPPYTRIENILLQAFPLAPTIQQPQLKSPKKGKSVRIAQLRKQQQSSYNTSKVKMFNVGNEVSIFKHLNFNAVFYAEVLAGSHQPNLMYMTTFENMADREAKWKLFNE